MNKFLVVLGLSLSLNAFAVEQLPEQARTIGNGGENKNCQEHFPFGAPLVNTAEKERIERRSFYLCRIGYAVQFDPATKTALWSAENLSASRMKIKTTDRTDDFRVDPEVPYPAQATLNDYKGSKFDRGHLAPAADMKNFDSELENQMMSESFYLTNMIPQVGPNNNRGLWSDLENRVRGWSIKKGDLYVVSGPIYEAGYQTMGKSKVAVPTKMYKVVISPKTYEAIAFIVPNVQIVTKRVQKLDKGNPQYPQTLPSSAIDCGGSCQVQDFAVPVSKVEELTGLKFFSRLDETSRAKIISTVNVNNWR